jgi:hypothetical protein
VPAADSSSTDPNRTLVGVFASAAFTGIALSVADAEALGGFVTVVALVGLCWAIHRFGRSGPDEPEHFE